MTFVPGPSAAVFSLLFVFGLFLSGRLEGGGKDPRQFIGLLVQVIEPGGC
jgi:hypothetical protein